MENYEVIKTIGTGSFARVELAKRKDSNEYVALKIIRKSRAFDLAQQVHTIWEYQVLSTLQHPFIVKLTNMFQDSHKIYFEMAFVIGGELFSLMKKAGKLQEIHTVFYSAQMVLALHYLHKNHIIYRALVPENILIDKDGYIQLTDFGFSKKLKLPSTLFYGYLRRNYAKYRQKLSQRNKNRHKLKLELNISDQDLFQHDQNGSIYDQFKLNDKDILPVFDEKILSLIRKYASIDETYTLCGTPEYVAPEILLNTGYSFEVDWWSLGIIIYELLTSVTPFAAKPMHNNSDTANHSNKTKDSGNNNNICDIYSNIVNGNYTTTPFPPTHLSKACQDMLRSLLVINPSQRLGAGIHGAINIMSHRFFGGINWVKLLTKKMKKVPWIPVVQSECDTSYFEEYDEEVEDDVLSQQFATHKKAKDVFKKNAFDKVHFDNSRYDDECKMVAFMIRQTKSIEFHRNGLLNVNQFLDLLRVLQLDDVYEQTVLERIFHFIASNNEDIALKSRKQVSYISYSDLIGCNYRELISIIKSSSQQPENQDFHILLSKLVLDQLQWVHDKIVDGITTTKLEYGEDEKEEEDDEDEDDFVDHDDASVALDDLD